MREDSNSSYAGFRASTIPRKHCYPERKFRDKWPVDPKDLFLQYYDAPDSDVMWSYDNEFRNNNRDPSQSPSGAEDGKDAYGFVMLDGPTGSLDNDFPTSHTVIRHPPNTSVKKRSILTPNSTIIGATFKHFEETIYVYCNFPQSSPECQKIWYKGAEDTIIKLPNHIGEGPYARVVLMDVAEPEYRLPKHHVQARSLKGDTNAIYRLKFDYDFHLSKRDDVVNMRVDFTNLLGYWDEITDTPAKAKRDSTLAALSNNEWRSKIRKAKQTHDTLHRKKLLDTVLYPGLSIKGIAAVGPTLDLYGQLRGKVTLKSEMRAGAKVNFGKAEVFWPQDDAASAQYQELLGLSANTSVQDKSLIEPTFDAKVRIDAQIDILVTPEANMGIRIGGPISGGSPLVDAQLVGFVNTTLSFQASAQGRTGTSSSSSAVYRYGVYLYYNLGYGAYATIKSFPNWALSTRYAYNPSPQLTIYENTRSFTSETFNDKRSIWAYEASKYQEAPPNSLISKSNGAKRTSTEYHMRELEDAIDKRSLQGNSTSAVSTDVLFGKRADTSGDGNALDPTTPEFTQRVTCPPGDTAQIRLPDYRLNCGVFRSYEIQGAGNTANVPGICDGVRSFFTAHSIANSEMVLTWDNVKKRVNARRRDACGNQYCTTLQNQLRKTLGDPNINLSCDEYPFAAAEEGGNYLRTLPINPTVPEKTCVPAWQNTLQGNCNKSLSNLQTNVVYFERQVRSDTAENWATWSTGSADGTWLTPGNVFNGHALTPQRLAEYPNFVPQSYGVSNTDYAAANGMVSWMYKRNFTFGLASPRAYNDGDARAPGTGGAKDWTLTDGTFPVGTDGGDLTAIACAVNTFQQHDVYIASYNGLCYNGQDLGSGAGTQKQRALLVFSGKPIALTSLDM
ncbi:hypothetical protein LTR50_007699 [Elasticomyces elasticus]|nr:hypothetical protein LTR50_007699 [Elasticomyces elasticus]